MFWSSRPLVVVESAVFALDGGIVQADGGSVRVDPPVGGVGARCILDGIPAHAVAST